MTTTNLKEHINTQANNSNNKNNNKNPTEQKQNKINRIIQLLTVAPELATLDCSLIHVLEAPNTQSYHS